MYRFILLVFLIFPGILNATEGYKNKVTVDSIPTKGFYKIILSPDLVSYVKSDLSDIRLMSSKGSEIPYILTKEPAVSYRSYFHELKIEENKPLFTPKTSRIVISNTDKKVFSGFILIIRNTIVEPEVIIKGSDDNKNWFFISREYLEKSDIPDNDTSEICSVRFPKNNYKFFEISVLHKKGEPIQILQAGYKDSEITKGYYTGLPSPKIIQKDSLKKSYVTIIFNRAYVLNKIVFEIEGPDFYMRSASIGKYIKQRNKIRNFDTWYNFTLSSAKSNDLEFESLKTDTLFLEIENEDNLPLTIKAFKAFQLNHYLIAQLDKNETYSVIFNNRDALHPDYDLKYFSGIIPVTLPILNISGIQIGENSVKQQPKSVFFNNYVVWIIIIIVIIVLASISIKMIKEMGIKKEL